MLSFVHTKLPEYKLIAIISVQSLRLYLSTLGVFCYKPAGHIITGILNIVHINKLRDVSSE